MDATWPVLDAAERRVLGVLVEKAKTTPDAYPMSLNALVVGCNQKSNRDPVMSLEDLEVEDAAARLQKKGLATRIVGTRVERWRHDLYDAWKMDKTDLAVIAELLLRGPQTEGELRGRVSRMESFADLEEMRKALNPMVERGLVVYLTPRERRGTTLTHGFHSPQEMESLRKSAASGEEATPTPAPAAAPSSSVEARLRQAESEIEKLKAAVVSLEARLAERVGAKA